MRKTINIILIAVSVATYGQTAEDHLRNGVTKHNDKNFKGAISDYTKAIKADKNYRDAYFNRGNCYLFLKDFKNAKTDFDKTIEIDDKFPDAYYSRSLVFVRQEKYIDALPDLNKTIDLDPSTPNALTTRGQIRAQSNNIKGACEDFNKANELGDEGAQKFITRICNTEQQVGESLMLDWPDAEGWKVASDQADKERKVIELLRNDETFENWTEIGTMMVFPGFTKVPVDIAMNVQYEQAKKNAPKAKLTFIEKDESTEYPWIIFTIESPNFKNDKRPESQLWFVIQGKIALYSNFRAVKKAVIPADLKDKWTKFFKTGKIVYKDK